MTTAIPTPDAPDIAVIIPHYDDPARLRRCLAAMAENEIGRAEILVVDNASPRPPEAVRAEFPAVRFLTETEKGAGPARNRGVAESRAPVLAFIDADCVPAPDWLATARAAAVRADLVGGRVSVFDETPPPRSGAEAFEAVFAFDFRSYIKKKGFSGAGNLVTHRRVFEAVGGFRNGISEDTEWTMRAVAAGHRLVYEDGLRVGHPSRADWPALRGKWRRLTQEAFATTGGGTSARLRWAAKALAMPASALVHLPKLLASPRLDGPGERLRGAATLMRLRLLRMVWMLRQAAGGRI